mmetsp:Transcript_11881/g.17716  ORF Transcript_11881/g.17716 Transcript_11881/m.17716 type:complete len:200 (-) Transcript_11881:28-627(-)
MKNFFKLSRKVFVKHAKCPQNRIIINRSPKNKSDVMIGQGAGCASGCVCNIYATISNNQTVEKVNYASVKLMLDENRNPIKTSKGNLLLNECECGVLNGLCSLATSQFNGQTLEQLNNKINYFPRAPDSALKNLLNNLKLQPKHKTCLQVVESALVSLIDERYLRPTNFSSRTKSEIVRESFDDETECEIDFRDQYKYM